MRQCVFSSADLSPALGLRGETGVGSREGMAILSSLVRIAEMRHKWLDVYLGAVSNQGREGDGEGDGEYSLVEFCCLRFGLLGRPLLCVDGAGDLEPQFHFLVAYRSRATPHTVG